MLHASPRGVRKYEKLAGIGLANPDKPLEALIKLGPKGQFAIPLLLDLAPADNRFPDTILALEPDHDKAFDLICANAKSRTPKVRRAAIESLKKAPKSRNAKAVQTLTAVLRLHTDAKTVTAVAQPLPRYAQDATPPSAASKTSAPKT